MPCTHILEKTTTVLCLVATAVLVLFASSTFPQFPMKMGFAVKVFSWIQDLFSKIHARRKLTPSYNVVVVVHISYRMGMPSFCHSWKQGGRELIVVSTFRVRTPHLRTITGQLSVGW